MKAVSLIMQFVLFFMIGFAFFLLAGNLFRFQSGLIRQDILNSSSKLAINQISAFSIRAVDSCKSCDNVTIRFEPKPIAGYNPTYQLSSGVILKIAPENKIIQSSMHNLYYSINYGADEVSSVKPIDLMYDRTKNNLVIK